MKKKEDDTRRGGYFRPQICRNCGINGHLYKDCLHPIMSFGIICYKIEQGEIKYIMIQRKDSLSFMEFVRGKYNQNDFNYIKQLIDYMTENEKIMILENTFDSIWNYTWCQTSQHNFKHTKEYIESKSKFEYVINNINLKNHSRNILLTYFLPVWPLCGVLLPPGNMKYVFQHTSTEAHACVLSSYYWRCMRTRLGVSGFFFF
jgi:hypothetical protein